MKHYLYAIGAILCWASLPAATGSALSSLYAEELLFYSFSTAALWLYLQGRVLNGTWRLYVPSVRMSALGIWGIFGYHYLYYKALEITPLAEGAVLTTTWSFWIVVFASVMIHKALRPAIIATGVAGMTGVAFVIYSGKDVSISMAYLEGYILCLLCGLVWGSFSVLYGRGKCEEDPMPAFSLYAAILSAVLFAIYGRHSLPSILAFGAAVYLGAVPLGLSFSLWGRALKGGNHVVIGFLSYFTPPLAVLLVAMVHGDPVSWQVFVGMGIITVASAYGKRSL